MDLDNDRLHVQYDPAKVSARDLVEAVDKQGFAASLGAGGAQAPPP